MGHSQAEKASSRERILTSAARRLRETGLDGLAVAELMKSAGLTHGGFYGHFKSRSDLIAAALDRAITDGVAACRTPSPRGEDLTFPALVQAYLTGWHRDHPERGCAISALANDVARAEPNVQKVMQTQLEQILGETADLIGSGPGARSAALAGWSTMVGAIALSRLFPGQPLADEILDAARSSLLQHERNDR